MRWVAIIAILSGCSGGHLESEITPPAHIIRVWPECSVLSGVLLDFSGLEHTDGAYWFGTFTGELIGSRIDGAPCDQTIELEPCNPKIGWCPSDADAGSGDVGPDDAGIDAGYSVECVNGTLVSGYCSLFTDTSSSICSCNLVGEEAAQRCKTLRASTLVCQQ